MDMDDFSWIDEGTSQNPTSASVEVGNSPQDVQPQVQQVQPQIQQVQPQVQQVQPQVQQVQHQVQQVQQGQQRPQARPQGQQPQAQRQQNIQGQQYKPRPSQSRAPLQQQVSPQTQEVNVVNEEQPVPVKKKSSIGLILIILAIIGVLGFVAYKFYFSKEDEKKPTKAEEIDYSVSGQSVYKNFESALHNFDATLIDSLVGTSTGDSFIAQEWAYVNKVKCREEFIKNITSSVTFSYPFIPQLSTSGKEMLDSDGNVILIESPMNNGENLIVSHPDYEKIVEIMEEDRTYIEKLFKASGYKETDYTWYDEMTNLFIQYYMDLGDRIPMKTTEILLPLENGVISDDSALDDLLFGSVEFHNMVAKFAQCSLGYTGFADEIYYEKEEQHNPEYDEWFQIFLQYFIADGGTYNPETGELTGYKNFVKGKSKWEPWYEYDAKGNIQKNEDGSYKVRYYSVKREDGTDWIQPAPTIIVDVEKHRTVEVDWVEETGILYNFIGMHYLSTSYKGLGSTTTRVGDGSIKDTAGVGTSIITKVLCTDGKYHDVRVTLMGYWTGKDAIDYVERFSSKNRGFSETSLTKLITYEIKIENLENTTITFESEMSLADKNSNIASRTGIMYGLTSSATLQPYESIIINDWSASTELDQKYVVWGKSFGRQYEMVYFNVLAGTGVIPTYSAYKQFTGLSNIEE